MDIDILIEDPAWETTDLRQLSLVAPKAVFAELSLSRPHAVISILACDDARIAALNAQFRGRDTATNVLSWPGQNRCATTPGHMPDLHNLSTDLGDIALAFGTIMREAREIPKPFDHHLTHLLVHGVLHLLGFDHTTQADAALMENLETRILARLGVPDPYSPNGYLGPVHGSERVDDFKS